MRHGEGPGGAPAAQAPSALGRPARSAASARGGGRLRTGRLLGYRRGCCWAIGKVRAASEGCKGLHATAYVRAHRHGRVELVVDLGLDRSHWSIIGQPLRVRVRGWHLAQ